MELAIISFSLVTCNSFNIYPGSIDTTWELRIEYSLDSKAQLVRKYSYYIAYDPQVPIKSIKLVQPFNLKT